MFDAARHQLTRLPVCGRRTGRSGSTYEVVEYGRRITLTGEVVFVFPNDAAQIAISVLVAFLFSLLFEVLSPYKSESDKRLARGGHVIVFLGMFGLLVL